MKRFLELLETVFRAVGLVAENRGETIEMREPAIRGKAERKAQRHENKTEKLKDKGERKDDNRKARREYGFGWRIKRRRQNR